MEENQEKNEEQPYPQSDPSEPPQPEMTPQPAESPEPEPEPTPQTREEAFAEVRQSLREEEQQKKPGFFDRLFKRARRKQAGPEEAVQGSADQAPSIDWEPEARVVRPASETPADSDTPPEAETPVSPTPIRRPFASSAPAQPGTVEQAEIPEEEIDNAIERAMRNIKRMPQEEPPRKSIVAPPAEEVPAAPHRSILTNIRSEDARDQVEEVESIRQGALEDYSAEPEEPPAETQVSLRQTARRTWRDMRPLERRILVTSLIVILVATVIGVGVLAFRSALPTPATPTPTLGNVPFPLSVSLPGGLAFPLSRGNVQDGKWNPSGAEWLVPTEVCRWISLPWSVQLEAVFRTLKADDPVSLYMSNTDSLEFKVRSIEQIPVDRIGSLASQEEPCVLLFLSEQDSDTRWVVRAVP